MSSCSHCVFADVFRDLHALTPMCKLVRDIGASIDFREKYQISGDCPYCIFFCDLVESLELTVGLPDNDIIHSYEYYSSLEAKAESKNFNSSLVFLK